MSSTSFSLSVRHAARIAGMGYLAIFITITFANSFALEKIIIAGDAATTAANIMASETLFRLGIAGWIVVLMCDAVVAWALYLFFKPVHEGLALLAAWMRILFVVIFAAGLLHLFPILELLSSAEYMAVFERDQLTAQVMLHLSAYHYAVHVSFVPFGLTVLVLGYLTFRSGNMPRVLGIFLMVAAAGYQIDSFGNFLSPAYAANEINFTIFVAVPAVTSEMWLTVWLLVKGAKIGLCEGKYATETFGRNYDVSPDGQGFLMVKEGGGSEARSRQLPAGVVQNWQERSPSR